MHCNCFAFYGLKLSLRTKRKKKQKHGFKEQFEYALQSYAWIDNKNIFYDLRV